MSGSERPEGTVVFVFGDHQCGLSTAEATWLAQELRVAYAAGGGHAPGRVVADRLELVLVGERPSVLALDAAEAWQVESFLRERASPGSPGLVVLRDALTAHLVRHP